MNKIKIILPCKNEVESLQNCIDDINKTLKGKDYKIIVIDNNSTDGSADIAYKNLVTVIPCKENGYGYAIRKGLEYCNDDDIVIISDCDGTYDFTEIPKFLDKLKTYNLVIGNRFNKANKGVMAPLNTFANFILRKLLRLVGHKLKETSTGFIAFKDNIITHDRELLSTGMELSSEILLEAAINEKSIFNITEVDISFSRRNGLSKVHIIKDSLRHLKIIWLYLEHMPKKIK